ADLPKAELGGQAEAGPRLVARADLDRLAGARGVHHLQPDPAKLAGARHADQNGPRAGALPREGLSANHTGPAAVALGRAEAAAHDEQAAVAERQGASRQQREGSGLQRGRLGDHRRSAARPRVALAGALARGAPAPRSARSRGAATGSTPLSSVTLPCVADAAVESRVGRWRKTANLFQRGFAIQPGDAVELAPDHDRQHSVRFEVRSVDGGEGHALAVAEALLGERRAHGLAR